MAKKYNISFKNIAGEVVMEKKFCRLKGKRN